MFVPLLVVASAILAQAEQYKGDKYHGRIESTMENKLVLLTDEDQLVEFAVGEGTMIMKNAQPSSFDKLESGDVAVVKATRHDGQLRALRISAVAPE